MGGIPDRDGRSGHRSLGRMGMNSRLRFVALFTLGFAVFIGPSAQAAAPANNDFANATVLNGAINPDTTPVPITGPNAEATGQTGEQNHAGVSERLDCSNATTLSG